MKLSPNTTRRVTLTVVGVAMAATLATTAPASAGRAESWVSTAGSDGSNSQYLNTSTIVTDPNDAVASTYVYRAFTGNAATGVMGAFARLFKSGILCAASSDYVYNSVPASGITNNAGLYANCGTGSYNSHGATKVFNGTSYNTYYTFPSSAQNFPG